MMWSWRGAASERVMLVGESGVGKSTLMAQIAAQHPSSLMCLSVDPGRPAFGCTGALAAARWEGDAWRVVARAGVATLDPVRWRLALVSAASRLARGCGDEGVLIDMPGALRGAGAAELHRELASALGVERVLFVGRDVTPLEQVRGWFEGVVAEVEHVQAHEEARALSAGARRASRWSMWEQAQVGAQREVFEARRWRREVAGVFDGEGRGAMVCLLGAGGQTLGMGLVERVGAGEVEVCWRRWERGEVAALVSRDARVGEGRGETAAVGERAVVAGEVKVAKTTAFELRQRPEIPFELGGPVRRGGALRMVIPGAVFDDPMLVVRFEHEPRAFLFDLGSVAQVPSKILHQADEVFLSHAHLDHIGGFIHLLRKSMGRVTPYRFYGPPAIAERVAHLLHGFTWDRIEAGRGPCFEVGELWGERLVWRRVDVHGEAPVEMGEECVSEGIILKEERLRVRAVALDHVTTSLAFSVEEPHVYGVRGDVLRARGLVAGDWLGELKRHAAAERWGAMVRVATVSGEQIEASVDELASALLIAKPGQKLVYATDFADTEANVEALVELARGADAMVCEASFLNEDAEQARLTRHLTTGACARIAQAAGVGLLIPFHPSVRYEDRAQQVWREVSEGFGRVYVPPQLRW